MVLDRTTAVSSSGVSVMSTFVTMCASGLRSPRVSAALVRDGYRTPAPGDHTAG